MIFPTGNKGRSVALGLALLALAAVVCAVAIPAYLLHQRYDNEIARQEDKIERYQKLAANRAEQQKAIDVIKARESARFFLRQTAPNLAGAELTDLVRPLIESNGSRLTSIQPATVKEEAGFRLYSINIGFNATPANLQKTLYALETALPYLFFENLKLTAMVPRGFKPQPNQEPEVAVQLEVQAYGIKDVPRTTRPANAAPAPSSAAQATGVKS
ncbi:MAG: type II secretion system protein GspM [Casimicrobium sp.]